MSRITEVYYIEDKYGNRLEFLPGEVALLASPTGFGMAEIEYLTTRGFMQDGETVQGFQAGIRPITLPLYYREAATRTEYWSHRNRLMTFLSAAVAPLSLGVFRGDATLRVLNNVYPSPGLVMETEENNWSVNEPILLTAYNPVWGGEEVTAAGTNEGADNLVFPTTFPIQFEAGGNVFGTGNISYSGTWKVYPTVTVTGAFNTAVLTNGWNGVQITYFIPAVDTEKRILSYSLDTGFRVTDAAGNNKIGTVASSSNFVDFYFQPGVVNSVRVSIPSGISGNTGLSVSYTPHFIGI